MLKLTAENVEKIFMDCLFEDGKIDYDNFIKVEGVVNNFGFDPTKISKHKDEIQELLNQLPDSFQEKIGAGCSFLGACMTKNNVQWGEHRNVEQLLVLGLASNQVKYCLPREVWPSLPGGVPYFIPI